MQVKSLLFALCLLTLPVWSYAEVGDRGERSTSSTDQMPPLTEDYELLRQSFFGCQIPFLPDGYRRLYNLKGTNTEFGERMDYGILNLSKQDDRERYGRPVVTILWETDTNTVKGIYVRSVAGTIERYGTLEAVIEKYGNPCAALLPHLIATLKGPQVATSGPITVRLHADLTRVQEDCIREGMMKPEPGKRILGCFVSNGESVLLIVPPYAQVIAHEICHAWQFAKTGSADHQICN